jgi:hypothetical protein
MMRILLNHFISSFFVGGLPIDIFPMLQMGRPNIEPLELINAVRCGCGFSMLLVVQVLPNANVKANKKDTTTIPFSLKMACTRASLPTDGVSEKVTTEANIFRDQIDRLDSSNVIFWS